MVNFLRSRAIRSLIEKIEEHFPPLRAWHRFEYEQHFFRHPQPNTKLFFGVYDSFEQARAAIPAGCHASYADPAAVARHQSNADIWPSDYAVLFWLARLLAKSASLFELGGNLGLAFYGFQKYLGPYPEGLRWTICELPMAVETGTKLAAERGATNLLFTEKLEEACGADIFLSSGTSQYLETPLWQSLASLRRKPRNVLLNRVPLCEGPSFGTLINIGPVICAYRIENRAEFIAKFSAIGYEMADFWETPEFSLYIPFHPERAIKAFSGVYFRLS